MHQVTWTSQTSQEADESAMICITEFEALADMKVSSPERDHSASMYAWQHSFSTMKKSRTPPTLNGMIDTESLTAVDNGSRIVFEGEIIKTNGKKITTWLKGIQLMDVKTGSLQRTILCEKYWLRAYP